MVSSDPATELPLASEFEPHERAQWQRLVDGVLRKRGGRPEDLITTTDVGIDIRPLYTAEDGAPPAGLPGLAPFIRGRRPEGHVATGWDVRALHAHPDPAVTNAAVLADLEGGVSSLWLPVGDGVLPLAALPEALNGVRLDLAPVVLDPGVEYEAAAQALVALLRQAHGLASDVTGTLGADPIGLRARTGVAHEVGPAAELSARLARQYPQLRTLVADGLPYHEAGGPDATELGAVVAAGVAYLRALTAAGLTVESAAARIEFRLAATADQFLTIAKLRAARRLWARVTELSGAGPAGMRQHAVTSPAMLTRYDPWVNMLRTTVACVAAGLGGADAVTVLPFDSALGMPEDFARRLARNTQAILLEESSLAAVIDPAGGSWYVENLTDEIAHAAWREFTAIERAGGIEAELDSGALAQRLERAWQARRERIATRTEPITGISEFPMADEQPLRRAPAVSRVDGGGLPRVRYAQDYERLRDRAEAHRGEYGGPPRVFLATLGPLAEHTARATFTANLLRAGGIQPVDPGPDADPVAAFRDSGTPVACLCGSDAGYAERASEVAAALRDAGASAVLLAGKPGDYEGVTGYLHTGCDALSILSGTLDTLGVAP
jgi:methylmalonyl-CoA mutase